MEDTRWTRFVHGSLACDYPSNAAVSAKHASDDPSPITSFLNAKLAQIVPQCLLHHMTTPEGVPLRIVPLKSYHPS